MRARLEPPEGPVRLVIDTDTHNEIDDQFALTWALGSRDVLEIEAVPAAPYSFAHHREPLLRAYDEIMRGQDDQAEEVAVVGSYGRWARNLMAAGTDPRDLSFVGPDEGMELSYREIRTVFELLDADPTGLVHRGSRGYLPAPDTPLESDAARVIIDRAMSGDERPLYVAAMGALTNIASAMLIEPRIIERIVVVWTSSYPSHSPLSNRPSLDRRADRPPAHGAAWARRPRLRSACAVRGARPTHDVSAGPRDHPSLGAPDRPPGRRRRIHPALLAGDRHRRARRRRGVRGPARTGRHRHRPPHARALQPPLEDAYVPSPAKVAAAVRRARGGTSATTPG